MPPDARLLTPYKSESASTAGVATPFSGGDFQIFNSGNTTWLYVDAMRFLHRDDLSALGITHVHMTANSASRLDPSAARLLEDPQHFRLLAEILTSSGARHVVYEVLPGAGTTETAPDSYRALRQLDVSHATVSVLGSLTRHQHWATLSAFAGEATLQSSFSMQFERGTLTPPIGELLGLPQHGMVVLSEPLEPTALGLSRAEAIWTGHGLRAHDLATAWSPVWRIGSERAALPAAARSVCESADGEVDLHILGEPATRVTAGSTEIGLTGLPQVVQLAVPDCGALTLSADAAIAPFVQIRRHHAGQSVDAGAPIAGLGFDGSVDGERAVLNFWYRNPDGIPFTTGTEFRLYDTSRYGADLPSDNANPRTGSLRWWPGAAALRAPEQIARIEFDARRLEINGDSGGGSASSLIPGETYLLTLNVVGTDPRYGLVEIQHMVPLALVTVGESGITYKVHSGIVTIPHHVPGTIYQRTGYDGGLAKGEIFTSP